MLKKVNHKSFVNQKLDKELSPMSHGIEALQNVGSLQPKSEPLKKMSNRYIEQII
jgi:hypothetical protein